VTLIAVYLWRLAGVWWCFGLAVAYLITMMIAALIGMYGPRPKVSSPPQPKPA
jgi:hypothetical protein